MALSTPKASSGIVGDPFHRETNHTSTPGVEQVLIQEVVPSGVTRSVYQVAVICRIEGRFRILCDGDMIGAGRTGAAQSNVVFTFVPPFKAQASQELKVVFETRPNSPAVTVECFMQASDLIE